MGQQYFIATAWNNGQQSDTGAGYGLKISSSDRDRFFDRSWKTVRLNLLTEQNGRTAEVNVEKSSFWSSICREMINKDIGRWFIDNQFAPWRRGRPPRFRFVPVREREFNVDHITMVSRFRNDVEM